MFDKAIIRRFIMKVFSCTYLSISLFFTVATAQKAERSVDDNFGHAEKVEVRGFVGKKLNLSYNNRILAQDVDHLIEPFRNRTETRLWQSEFWGKWFTSAVLAYRYKPTPELREVLQRAVDGLIETQTPDGYIGNYAEESHLAQWDIWGRKYTMLGLLDYYSLTEYKPSLEAARKVADHLIREIAESDGHVVTKGNYRGMAASSVLEPMLKLYRITRDETYLKFSKQIVIDWETPLGPQLISKASVDVSKRFPKPKSWYSPEQGQKAYEMMSCYEGLLELYRITGNPKLKEAVEQTWENIKDTEINIAGSGASEEMWFGGNALQTMPIAHYQETCVTVTWIKLNQQLLRLTGEAKYADEIERSYYNALIGSMSGDGSDWAKYTPLNGERLPGSGQCGMDLNCCNASGPRALFALPHQIVTSTPQGLSINFFMDGDYNLITPKGKSVVVTQRTNYPVSGKIDFSLLLEREEEMTLQIRIPSWSVNHALLVNGAPVSGLTAGSYVELRRKWAPTDEITLQLEMQGKVVTHGKDERKFVAITRGPVVLAIDSRFEGPALTSVNRPVVNGEGYIQLKPVELEESGDVWMLFKASFVPESYREQSAAPVDITLCDYASAGNGSESSAFKVWLPQLYSGRAH